MLKTNCTGAGECLKKCYCDCDILYGQYDDEYTPCKCGHRDHNGYCPVDCSNCCVLTECHNNRLCYISSPQHELDKNDGICNGCVKRWGKLNWPDICMNCPVCERGMEMIQLACGHMSCILCWRSNTYVDCVQCSYESKAEAEEAAAQMAYLLNVLLFLSIVTLVCMCVAFIS